MYQVQAQIVLDTPHGTLSRQVPTFYLDPTVQGIVSDDHAARIAQDILRSIVEDSDARIYTVVQYVPR